MKLILGGAVAFCMVWLSACGGGTSSTPVDANNGVLHEQAGATACAYDQYLGGGGKRLCTNTTQATCNSEIYGGNQQFYTHSRCSDLGL